MLIFFLALLVSSMAHGIDLAALDDLVLTTDQDSEVHWYGDGFKLSCPVAKSCHLNARNYEPGEYTIRFYRWQDSRLFYGSLTLNILKTIGKRSEELKLQFSQNISLKDSFEVPLKGYAIHYQNSEAVSNKDLLLKISKGDSIKSVVGSTVLVQLSEQNNALLIDSGSVLVEETSEPAKTLSWQSGNMVVSLAKGQGFKLKNGDLVALSEFFRAVIVDKKNELYMIPIVGDAEFTRKEVKAKLSPPFGLWLTDKSLKQISTLSCEDPFEKALVGFVSSLPCENIEVSDLGITHSLLNAKKVEVTNQIVKSISTSIYKPLTPQIADNFEARLKTQSIEEIHLEDPFLGKIRYFYYSDQCGEIKELKTSSSKEEQLSTYYLALCSERVEDYRDTTNRLKWLNNDDLDSNLLLASKEVLSRQEVHQLPVGKFSLFIGRDSNAFKKSIKGNSLGADKYPYRSAFMVGGIFNRQYSLFKEGLLTSRMTLEGNFSVILAQKSIQFARHSEGVNFPFTFATAESGIYEVTPGLIAMGVGYPLDVVGVGIKTRAHFPLFFLGSNYQSFDDFNDSPEFIDFVSGNPISLQDGKKSDRPFTRKDYYFGHELTLLKSKVSVSIAKKLGRNLHLVEEDFSFSSWEAKIEASYQFNHYYNFLSVWSFEKRRYLYAGSARILGGEVEGNWDFSPKYALFSKLVYQSSRGQRDALNWTSWAMLLGVTTLWR
jgi:hypothetical protein